MAKRIANSELIENQSQFIITIKLNIYFNYNRLTLCILKHFNGSYCLAFMYVVIMYLIVCYNIQTYMYSNWKEIIEHIGVWRKRLM